MSETQEDKANVGTSDAPVTPGAAVPAAEAVTQTSSEPITAPATPGATERVEVPFEGPGVRVRYAGRSAVGLVREHNEDNLVIANLASGTLSPREQVCTDQVGADGILFAVCDGMGGAAAGEVASQMAVEILLEAMRRGGAPKDRDELARRLVSVVEEAGKRIFDSAQKERAKRGMGTTATVASLVDKVLFLAEVGDSRGYLLRGGVLKQLTKDQSLVNQLIEAGHLTEAEAEAFEHSNIILQALGTSETVQVDLTFVELRTGDRLMMCSDGLSGLVHFDTIREALGSIKDPNECTATLVKYAEAGGGHDNITVLVIDFDGDALEASKESDSFGYLQYPLLPAGGGKDVFGDEEITDSGAIAPVTSAARKTPLPPHGRGQDEGDASDRGSWLWLSAGIAVLLAGAWVLAMSGSSDAHSEAQGAAAPVPGETAAKMPQVAPIPEEAPVVAAPEPKPVPVHVWSDVRDATLLVNGEAHGRFTAGASQNMELRPGAYRFEAQSSGNIAAVEVVTVRPDVPLDVYLRLPSGTSDHAAKKPDSNAPGAEAPTQTAPKAAPATPHGAAAESKPAAAVTAVPPAPAAAPKAVPAKTPDPSAKPAGAKLPDNPF